MHLSIYAHMFAPLHKSIHAAVPISIQCQHQGTPIDTNQMSEQSTKDDDNNNNKTAQSTAHQRDKSVLEPYHYIDSVPGKDVRGKLIDCFQLWLRVNNNNDDSPTGILDVVKEIIRKLHTASLMVDDIEDNSKLRRGVPVAHHIFGVAPVINCANYVYFLALEDCHGLGNGEAIGVFVSELLNLHRGQGQDIMWRDNVKCPTEDQYCKMVIDKTGGLFRLAVGLLQSFATKNKTANFTPLVNNLALYFQIRDDLINLADSEYMKSKSFCEDLTEGKFSFPIIHAIRNDETDSRLLNILKQRTEDVDIKRYAQGLLRDAGSLTYTCHKCHMLKVEIEGLIEGLGGNPPLLKVLDMLHAQIENMNFDELETEAGGGGDDGSDGGDVVSEGGVIHPLKKNVKSDLGLSNLKLDST